jgi:hypothetical protein
MSAASTTWFATYVIGPCLFMLLLVVIAMKLARKSESFVGNQKAPRLP